LRVPAGPRLHRAQRRVRPARPGHLPGPAGGDNRCGCERGKARPERRDRGDDARAHQTDGEGQPHRVLVEEAREDEAQGRDQEQAPAEFVALA